MLLKCKSATKFAELTIKKTVDNCHLSIVNCQLIMLLTNICKYPTYTVPQQERQDI